MFPYLPLQRSPAPETPALTCVPDPYYDGVDRDEFLSFVALAVLFNDANNSATAVSRIGPAVTRFGTAIVSNDQMHFGANTYKNATGDNSSSFRTGGVLTVPAAADFCLEAWAYFNGAGGYRHIIQLGTGLNNRANIALNGGVLKGYLEGTTITNLSSGVAFPSGQWVHTALVKDGGTLRLFQDGVQVASAACGALNATGVAIASIGTQNFSTAADDHWVGYLDDARVTIGAGRYSATDLPDLQPLIFEGQFTVLSLHGESIVDSSSEPKTLTNNGVTISATPKFGANAIAFSGTAQRVTVAATSDFHFESEDYTVEAWLYPTVVSGQIRHWFSFSENLTGDFAYCYFGSVNPNGSIQAYVQPATAGPGVAMASAAGLVTPDAWYHVMFCRQGANAYLFLDGDLVASTSAWVDFPAAKVQHIAVGSVGNGYTDGTVGMWQGYIDDLRVTRGVVRHVPEFDVPTSAHGNDVGSDPLFASVVLLAHMDNTAAPNIVIDSSIYARPTTSTTLGAAAQSPAQFKFGAASMYVYDTGFGAYTVAWPSSGDFNISGSDFTIELWARESSGSLGSLICRRPGGQATGWVLTVVGVRAIINGVWSDSQMSWTRPSYDVWHHYALVRYGTTLLAFIDGALVSAKGGVTAFGGDNAVVLAICQADNASENKFLGYIDDVRFTRAARYLQTFTPPALTFCDYAAEDTTPVAAPSPAPGPTPPDTTPPVFTVAAVSPVDFTISTAISPARTLATITTTETAVSIVASASVPGVTFNVVGSPVTSITASGTPTTAAQTRVVLTYVRNDGSGLVLGSSTHVINVIDPSILFVAGANASYSGRAGVPVSATLCSPSLALDVDVLAFPTVGIPGCTVSLAWTRGGTSTGVLTLAGTPTTEGVYSLTVTYYALGRIVGTSAHTITITAAWTPAPSPPAPAPAPTPPTPAPVPSPPAAPASGPLPAADPHYASVLLLHRFNAADVVEEVQSHRGDGPVTGGGEVLTITRNFVGMRPEDGQRIIEVTDIRPRPYRGNSILPGQFTRVLNVCTMNNGPIADLVGMADAYFTYREPLRYIGVVGPSLSGRMISGAGAAGEAAGFDGGTGLRCDATAAMGAATTALTVECYVTADDATGLWAGGSGSRYTPLVSCVNPGNQLVWTLGLWSFEDGYSGRVVTAVMWRATTGTPSYSISPQSSIASAPGGFLHIAGQWSAAGALGCWWAGEGGAIVDSLSPGAAGRPIQAGAYLVVGGSCPPPQALNMPWTIKPLVGRMDELRITAAERYSLAGTGPAPLLLPVTEAISAALRAIPFAGY